MPSDKHNSITAKATDLISSLLDFASSGDVLFHQLLQLQYSAGIMVVQLLPLFFLKAT